jgi:rhamnose transport system ATP-binding protein
VILVSSELPEVMSLAHRVIVMRRGRQVHEFARGHADAEAIVAAASGLEEGGVAAPVSRAAPGTGIAACPTELAA